jgi:hypothetical protein
MPYRVRPDGSIETDTAEEALTLAALLDRKKHGNWARRGNGEPAATGKKTSTRRRGKPKTRAAAQNGRRPSEAVKHGVKLGQVYQKHGTDGRVIQIEKLETKTIVPKIVKDSKGTKRKGVAKRISYATLRATYKLVKDV